MVRERALTGPLWEGFRSSTSCSRDTYPESYITEYILIYEEYGEQRLPNNNNSRDIIDPYVKVPTPENPKTRKPENPKTRKLSTLNPEPQTLNLKL
jgi:hypothetical protein